MYYILCETFTGHKLTLRTLPYTEQGFSTYSQAYRHKRKHGGDTICREDRISEVVARFESRNN